MACTQVTLSGSSTAATANDMFCMRRSRSAHDVRDRVAALRRTRSDIHLRCSLNPARSSSAEPRLKPRSEGIFSLSAGSVLSSVRSSLFEPDYAKGAALVEQEEEKGDDAAVEKRSNWVEILMELRGRWRGRHKGEEDEVEASGESEDEAVCEVSYEEVAAEFDRSSFSRYLVPVSLARTKLFSSLAFLCNMAYVIPEIRAEDLRNHYDLELVTSSLDKKAEAAMVAAEEEAVKAQLDRDSVRSPPASDPENAGSGESGKKGPLRPAVAYKIGASAATYVHLRAKGMLSLDDSGEEECGGRYGRAREVAPSPSSPSRVYNSEMAMQVATSTMTAVVAAEEPAKMEAARALRSPHSAPCEWFVCDEPSTCTRFFVIQGSDSLASWQANLFFDPTQFEGTEVLVHRGIYEAAKGIYEQFMPEIEEHLERYGEDAKFRFTGHSLGGSLSLLVSLLVIARKVVKPSALLPVVTFGSPSIFCGGQQALEELGLDEDHVYSVMMHRDIVPRAFSCDYPKHIAQILKRVSGAFRSHPCLNKNKLLYSPLGKLYILQPEESSSPYHPLLPPVSALYAMDKHRGESPMAALRAFLNLPHPLETLKDLTAYGSDGTILRDHDSSNYLKAINTLLRKQVLGRSQSRTERLMLPLLTVSPYTWVYEASSHSRMNKEIATGV